MSMTERSLTPRAAGRAGTSTEPDPDTWQNALTRRLRTLIRTSPLHRIEASKGQRDIELGAQDLRALALRALDLTIEHMGLGSGATAAQLCEELVPLVLQCEPGIGSAQAAEIATLVLEALLNERDRRQAFREEYLSVDADHAERRVVPFHLLREHALPDGSIVLRATTEAINLYAGMLEYPVEDAQIAEEAVLRSQVKRGRIADAVRTAQRARLRSIEYEQKVLGILETTRRDVQQIDWVREVLGLLEHARTHLEERLASERELITAVEVRLEALPEQGGIELASLRDTLDECYGRHLRLHQRIIPANQQYLDEQDRQSFRPRALTPLPDLEADVLRPALGLPTGVLAASVDRLLARFQAPRAPAVVSLRNLVERLLAPPRADDPDPLEIDEVELEALPEPPPSFSPEDHAAVARLLSEVGAEPVRLGALIERARNRGSEQSVEALLVLELLLGFDPGEGPPRTLTVESAEEPLDDRRFVGDDLAVRRSG
jgi:hypothetical protein